MIVPFSTRIESSVKMDEPNEPIKIYEGLFTIQQEEDKLELNGKIQFDWIPDFGVHFSGETKTVSKGMQKRIFGNGPDKTLMTHDATLLIDGISWGVCMVNGTSFNMDGDSTTTVKGTFKNHAIKGDKSIPVNKIMFSTPNLRKFNGEAFKTKTGGLAIGRMRFENEKYVIVLDQCKDYNKSRDLLNSKGGYMILYNCELTKKSGNIAHDEITDFSHCIATFLSFLNGRRTAPLFIQGIFDEKEIWCDYAARIVDTHKSARSWPSETSIEGLNNLWMNYNKLWHDEDNRNFIISAIHWYMEANTSSGYMEGKIITAQIGLELIYNWLLIENKKILQGKDAENISASNKIRLLLSHINIKNEIPVHLTELQKFIDSNKDISDGPEAIVQIRNAIVHSQEDKRRKLSSINSMAKYEALQLSIWYIELALLSILEFNGHYTNRCFKGLGRYDQEIPWFKKTA